MHANRWTLATLLADALHVLIPAGRNVWGAR